MPNNRSIPPPPGTRLTLVTLGGAALTYSSAEQGVTTALRLGKALALVVYLAASPQRTASRDHLIDLLWANLEPDVARRALRQAVWFIRHRVGEEILVGHNHDLALAETVRCDRDELLDAVESGELERAVELYHGVFMPGFAAPGGAEFEHWADLERDRLPRGFLRAGEAVVRRDLSRCRWHAAPELVERGDHHQDGYGRRHHRRRHGLEQPDPWFVGSVARGAANSSPQSWQQEWYSVPS